MGNVSLKVLEKSLNFLLKNGYEPCMQMEGMLSKSEQFLASFETLAYTN